MNEIKTLVVATDFSENAQPALDAATTLAKTFGAELHVVHAFQTPVPIVSPYEVVVPDGFLEEMMDLRGDLEDVVQDEPRRLRFREGLEERLQAQLAEAGRQLEARELGPARRTLNVAAYYRGLLRDLKEAAASH